MALLIRKRVRGRKKSFPARSALQTLSTDWLWLHFFLDDTTWPSRAGNGVVCLRAIFLLAFSELLSLIKELPRNSLFVQRVSRIWQSAREQADLSPRKQAPHALLARLVPSCGCLDMLDGEQDAPQSAARGAKRATTPPRRADSQKSKRVRVSRACDQCRAGREKCDGGQPSCHTCEAQERVCSYHEQPKKRGIQPNYIRTLELTLAWIFQNSPDSETRISQELPDATGSAHRLIAWKDANASEGLHAAWRSSIVCRQIDQLLSGASIDIPQHTASDGRASEVPYQSPPLSAPSDNSIPLNTSTFDALSPTNSRNPQSALVSSSDLLRLPENSWALLEHYLAFTQTWLPIVERHDILKLMYTYPTTGLPYKDAREAGHAELWSIMALASFQLGGTNSDAEHCRNIVRSLIPQEHGFQLGHIKALLVLSLLDLMKDAKVSAWLTVGSAVRLLTHFHFGKGTNTTLFEGRTKHTVLAAFVLEHCVASHTGAIMHIRTADIRELGLLIEDGLEEWSPWQDPSADASTGAARLPSRSISTFNECVRIAFQQVRKCKSPLIY